MKGGKENVIKWNFSWDLKYGQLPNCGRFWDYTVKIRLYFLCNDDRATIYYTEEAVSKA